KGVEGGIVYGMWEVGMGGDKGDKKWGRMVGEVIGKYDGDGDCGVYEWMVGMVEEEFLRKMVVGE
uniref:hypothetical protein n=1 Tax=Geobacillus sp. (strain Y412MC10) TaxID=481743 RepID=UPI0011AA2096